MKQSKFLLSLFLSFSVVLTIGFLVACFIPLMYKYPSLDNTYSYVATVEEVDFGETDATIKLKEYNINLGFEFGFSKVDKEQLKKMQAGDVIEFRIKSKMPNKEELATTKYFDVVELKLSGNNILTLEDYLSVLKKSFKICQIIMIVMTLLFVGADTYLIVRLCKK